MVYDFFSGPYAEANEDGMIIANQYSSTINVLKVHWDTGTLEDTGISCPTPRPCCIQS